MVTYSVPIFLGGNETQELKGVLTADISLEWLHQRMKTLRVGETGYGAILSEGGYVVSHPDETLLRHLTVADLEAREPAPEVVAIVERMMKGESGFEPIHDRHLGKPARMTYAPIGHAGWSLAVVYPDDELMADVNFVTRRQAILLIVGLLLLVAVVIGLSRRMTKPIKALAGSAGRIATGDLDLELPTSQSEDEIGALTRAFGNMRDSLKTYIRNLKETSTSIASGSSLASRFLEFLERRHQPRARNLSMATVHVLLLARIRPMIIELPPPVRLLDELPIAVRGGPKPRAVARRHRPDVRTGCDAGVLRPASCEPSPFINNGTSEIPSSSPTSSPPARSINVGNTSIRLTFVAVIRLGETPNAGA